MDDFEINNNRQNTRSPEDISADSESVNSESVYSEPVNSEPVYSEPSAAQSRQDGSYYSAPTNDATQPQSPYNQPQSPYTRQTPDTPPSYYQAPTGNAYNTAPVAEKKKRLSGGAIAFIAVLGSLLLAFIIGFTCIIAVFMTRTNHRLPGYFNDIFPSAPFVDDSTTPDSTEPTELAPQTDDDDLYSSSNSIIFAPIPSDKDDTSKYNTQSAYKAICDSTVGVVCYTKGSDSISTQGTGIIVSSDGYIVTNSHVIGDSKTAYDIKVVLSSNTSYDAKVIGFDSRTDLAVLKVSASGLKAATFCDSDLVEIGQDVIAVGNPGGINFQNSLTRGIVSALDRELSLSTQVSYIQTDAAINPGNSGGALCNIYGQVIGVTSAKLNTSTYEGVGFAIPSRTVKEIVDDLMSQGYVNGRVRIGIVGVEVGSSYETYHYGVSHGIIVKEISADGPCCNTELRAEDVITSIDGTDISTFSEVYKLLSTHKPGDKITLGVFRPETKKTMDIKITLIADTGESQQ